ncbi:MAG: insulinase family protein [Phycisphaeraceae bacterium]|nr:insulinase family protein [Phycisphaeraceae bacterium]MCW5753932.1 insulinase family protein [Phycisphaeraceae bacterium]
MPVTFKHATLPNGLTIVAEVDPDAHSAAAGFFVRTGARDEPSPVMGVSHFLEHMMFKGTHDLTAEEINRGFDELGARNNAYTSHEMTVFYAHTLPEKLTPGVDLLARMMRPALRQEDFDTEKGVILEEIAMYKDEPFWVLYEAASERHFTPHPLGHRVLGTEETIRDLTSSQMRAYFESRYSADNTTLALAGNLDFDRIVDQVGELCRAWQTTRPIRDAARPATNAQRFVMRDAKVSRAYILALADAPSVQDQRRYAASLLMQILGGADNSRLHWALIETGIAEQAQASFDPRDGCGEYFIFAAGDPARHEEIWDIVERQVADLKDSLTEWDLERLRAKYATSLTVGSERPADRMQRLGRIWTSLHEYRTLESELERINAVTLDDLRTLLDAFPLSRRTVGILLPQD